MSEYWVSKKKYFCKYCDIYIADDAPSRQHHENGLRHKGNVERFIRGIYKAGEKQKKDLEEEKREMKRVEQAAAAAFAEDIGAGRAKSSAPVASTSSAPKKPAPKPSNPFANYSTAQSLGYSDPDAERLAAELELRRSQGVAGEWQILTSNAPPVGSLSEVPSDLSNPSAVAASEIGVKREAEAPLEEEDTRNFKLRKKTLNTGLGEIYDPGALPIKIKKKEDPMPDPVAIPSSSQEQATVGALKWTATPWKRPGETSHPQSGEGGPTTDGNTVKVEEEAPSVSSKWTRPQWSQPLPDLKQEERKNIFGNPEQTQGEPPGSEEQKPFIKTELDGKTDDIRLPIFSEGTSTGGLFKKRKAPNGAGRGRREI